MDLKDKRLIDQMDLDEQAKYTKDLNQILSDAQDKFEACEVVHNPINLLKKLKPKSADETHKEKASDQKADQRATKGSTQ